ncbi:hypothetical protein V492_01010 [Pseudogymnoascus sp. VKM F-4246]|nr:hypothetical protein V492_01010 [Pseudogymnoascus sp. VKM F-4246]
MFAVRGREKNASSTRSPPPYVMGKSNAPARPQSVAGAPNTLATSSALTDIAISVAEASRLWGPALEITVQDAGGGGGGGGNTTHEQEKASTEEKHRVVLTEFGTKREQLNQTIVAL